jgi:hypothetical protein
MRPAGTFAPFACLLVFGGLAALPGCAAAPAVNMASQLLQTQHTAQSATTAVAGEGVGQTTASPLALLGNAMPSGATLISIAQHLGLPVGGTQTGARPQPLIGDPYGARPVPDADLPTDGTGAAQVAAAQQ